MKHVTFILAASLLSVVVLQTQQSAERPFAVVEQAVKEERAGWAGNKERLSTVFDAERRRLCDRRFRGGTSLRLLLAER